MICIKENNGKISRVKTGLAREMVADGKATFIKKSEWRKIDPDWEKRSIEGKKIRDKQAKEKAEKETAVEA